jgi:hypothetical protein
MPPRRRDERLEVVASAGRMVQALVEQSRAAPRRRRRRTDAELDAATAEIERQFDAQWRLGLGAQTPSR